MKLDIAAIVGYLAGLTGLIKFIFDYRTRKANAFSGMQEAYDKFTEDSNAKYDELRKEVEELKEYLTQSRVKYNKLKKEFEDYKAKHKNCN